MKARKAKYVPRFRPEQTAWIARARAAPAAQQAAKAKAQQIVEQLQATNREHKHV
jgi:hypothetical protein